LATSLLCPFYCFWYRFRFRDKKNLPYYNGFCHPLPSPLPLVSHLLSLLQAFSQLIWLRTALPSRVQSTPALHRTTQSSPVHSCPALHYPAEFSPVLPCTALPCRVQSTPALHCTTLSSPSCLLERYPVEFSPVQSCLVPHYPVVVHSSRLSYVTIDCTFDTESPVVSRRRLNCLVVCKVLNVLKTDATTWNATVFHKTLVDTLVRDHGRMDVDEEKISGCSSYNMRI
jgi:hypothetical protein